MGSETDSLGSDVHRRTKTRNAQVEPRLHDTVSTPFLSHVPRAAFVQTTFLSERSTVDAGSCRTVDEVVATQHLLNGDFDIRPMISGEREFAEPLGVVPLAPFCSGSEHFRRLGEVGLLVRGDVLGRQIGRSLFCRSVADELRVVADEEDGVVPELLDCEVFAVGPCGRA